MAYNYEYPYVDPNRYNSDWILNKIKETYNLFKELDDKLAHNFTELMREYFNKIMPDVVYQEENERVVLSFIDLVGDGVHYYDSKDGSMIISDDIVKE